jgi:hypothetical protein
MVEGGCLCGAVRYRVEGTPLQAGYCHCRMCQRASGAPVVAWGTWPMGSFSWLQGSPNEFASAPKGIRSFCPSCGTPLTFIDPTGPAEIDVTLASLDDPATVRPEHHGWTMSRIPWLEIADTLPRRTDGGPSSSTDARGSAPTPRA